MQPNGSIDAFPILWHSVSPHHLSQTGYSQQTAMWVPKIKRAGFPIGVSGFSTTDGPMMWEGIPIFPRFAKPYGSDVVELHARQAFGGDPKRGIVISFCDLFVLDPADFPNVLLAAYFPVDHEPLSPDIRAVLDGAKAYPITYSRFGYDVVKAAGYERVGYAPHGVDTGIYKPAQDRAKARERFGLPSDALIFGMVAKNLGTGSSSRKNFDVVGQAFANLLASIEDPAERAKTLLYLHTDALGNGGGVDLPEMFQACGVPHENIVWSNQYAIWMGYEPETMADLYASFDYLVAPSRGEGFCLPLVEAQACGTPCIVSNFSAQPELLAPGTGFTVHGDKFWGPQRAFQFNARPASLMIALRRARDLWKRKAAYEADRAKCAEWVADHYDADLVFDRWWMPLLADLAAWRKERLDDGSAAKALAALSLPPAARQKIVELRPKPPEPPAPPKDRPVFLGRQQDW